MSDEWVNDWSRSEHPVPVHVLEEYCSMCGDYASHKIGEEGTAIGHNMTNWLCCLHFRVAVGDCGDRRTADDSVGTASR